MKKLAIIEHRAENVIFLSSWGTEKSPVPSIKGTVEKITVMDQVHGKSNTLLRKPPTGEPLIFTLTGERLVLKGGKVHKELVGEGDKLMGYKPYPYVDPKVWVALAEYKFKHMTIYKKQITFDKGEPDDRANAAWFSALQSYGVKA